MIEFKKELITPTIAKQLLEANVKNRAVKRPVVLAYANEMLAGRWKADTGEAIKISKTNIILDGQHRLLAVIKSGVATYFHVAKNLDDSVFTVLDTGSVRNATDSFKISGISQSNSIPSIISMYNLLCDGKKMGIQIHKRATSDVLLNQYYSDELFWQNVAKKSHAWYLSFAKILTPSLIGGFFACFSKLNHDKAEEFMNQLTTGINVTNNTILLLRNKLMQDKMSPRKMPPTLKMALIIKTWNNFIENKEPKILKYDSIRDEFPTMVNRLSV